MTALTASIVIGLALSCAPGIDPAIVAGIATAESHLDPSAVTHQHRWLERHRANANQ